MQQYWLKVSQNDAGMRVDNYILKSCQKQKLEFSRAYIQKLIRQGNITLNGKPLKPHYKLKEGDTLRCKIEEKKPFLLKPEDIPLDIVYEDKDVMVINKPPGLVVHPACGHLEHTLVNALLHHTKELSNINPLRPGIVHRLDKDTSGLMLIAKNNHAHWALVRQFSKHAVRRKYIAVVKGKVEFDEGSINLPIARHSLEREKMAVSFGPTAKEALTYYRTLRRSQQFSLLELVPYTGRTHQLRVHLASQGHPICGDKKYAKTDIFKRLALHAQYIGFIHPTLKKFMEFSTPPPQEFLELFKNA
ncbi:MAG: RluA family pseudouridine synthase [Candidatus Omnitrophica bacterium]|nr:RluA family pseudouridine synthase [Candidatus Omnitrophota bacterium]MCM8771076.1 RluA family pseudouridine synthase [Candidatus Omnitrophota bacterium]